MLLLTILATIVEGFGFIQGLNRGFLAMRESDAPGETFIGVLIGLAISALPIVALWVLYSRI